MDTKRGFVIVVALILLLIVTASVLAEGGVRINEEKKVVLGKKVEAPTAGWGCDYDNYPPDCFQDEEGGLGDGEEVEYLDDNERAGIVVEEIDEGIVGGSCLDSSLIKRVPTSDQNSCRFVVVERDDDTNDGVIAQLRHGTKIDVNWQFIDPSLYTTPSDCETDGDAVDAIDYAKFRSPAERTYICSSDNYWHLCLDDPKETQKDEETGKINYENIKYYGTYTSANNKVYNCSDYDYTTKQKTEIVTWRELPGFDKDNDGFTNEMGDCRDDPANDPLVCEDLESSEDCSNIKYSSCAICINPAQTEIGGDGIDNSCRTGKTEDDVLNVDDDMDKKEYKEVCLGKQSNSEHKYDFLESKEGNSCCGDDGIDDLGSIIKTNSGKFICLTSEKDFVSLQVGGKEVNSLEEWGDKTWKWVSPSVNTKFTILTINKPGEKSYDVVSNGLDWKACSKSTEGSLESSQFELLGSGDKYRCLATENQDIWVECCKEGVSCQSASGADGTKGGNINGIKIRHPGQGLFDLLPFLKDNSVHFSSLGSSTAYADIYGKRYPSFAGFAYLDIYFQFADETVPADVGLQLEVFSTSGKIVSENVLSHIVNGAAIEGKRTYHAQIPISGWRDVTILSFVALPKEIKIEFKDIHAAKKGADPGCSSDSAWLDSLDSPSSGVEPGKMCEDLGLQWLGESAAEPSLRCCGNTAGEYGIGDGKSCWNSQGLKAGETANNVQVELTYGKGEWSYEINEKNIEVNLVDISSGKILITEEGGVYSCVVKEEGFIPCYTSGKIEVYNFESKSSFETFLNSGKGYTCGLDEMNQICIRTDLSSEYPLETIVFNRGKFYSQPLKKSNTQITKGVNTNSQTKIKEVTFTKTNFVEASLKNIQGGKVYFFDPLKYDQYSYDDEKTTIKYDDLTQEKTTYYIMAEADTLKQTFSYNPTIIETLTYSCRFDSSQPACAFPLKGSAPYTIRNLFPQNYDFYFVTKTAEGQEIRTFINPEKTVYAPNGWLEAVNLPKQVLFDGKSFMGCGDTASLEGTPLTAEKFCSAKKLETSGFYCSPEGSWKNDELKVTGYDENNNLQFLPDASPQKPEERTHLSPIVFGRNLLLNPMLDLTK